MSEDASTATIPSHVAAIAEMVAEQIADGYSMHGLVSAEHFGRRYRYSREQARHVLNNAAKYGAIEKVRVSSLGVDVPHFGAQFGFRPPSNSGRCSEHGCTADDPVPPELHPGRCPHDDGSTREDRP